jgi:hypothetical protein
MKTVDVIIPLGKGSRNRDLELRFALRSLEANLITPHRIILVSENMPEWMDQQKVVHIYAEYPLKMNKDGNIINKVLRALGDERLSPPVTNDFIFMADDNVIMSPMRAENFGYYHVGDLQTKKLDCDKNNWHKKLRNSYDRLKDLGYHTLNWESHCPVVFNRQKFIDTYRSMFTDFDLEGEGFTIYTMYFNTHLPDQYDFAHTIKYAFERPEKDDPREVFARQGLKFISYNDKGFTDALKAELFAKFPKRSVYEMDDVEIPKPKVETYLNEAAVDSLYDQLRDEMLENHVNMYHYLQGLRGRYMRLLKKGNLDGRPDIDKDLRVIETLLDGIAGDMTLKQFLQYNNEKVL